MPRKQTGSPRLRGGRWFARVPLGNQRLSVALATCKPADKTKARERAALLCDLGARLAAAGHGDLVSQLLERAGAADGKALADVVAAVDKLHSGEAVGPLPQLVTVRHFGEQWTDGTLHRRWPDHVKDKKSADDDRERLRRYVYPVVGEVALTDFTLKHADAVMAALPDTLNPSTRRHCAQVMSRLLKLATYPARIIERSPLPTGFLPRMAQRKALAFLYPSEDAALLRCAAVPLARRLFYGFADREGCRRSEQASLTWKQLDLDVGIVRLDENKTDDPRVWALRPDVVRALKVWREMCFSPSDDALVFVDEEGAAVATSERTHAVTTFRDDLRRAGVSRSELFERSSSRQPIRLHDLRATFVTISLATGNTETFVADRTGHKSSVMINRYRRAARHAAEVGLGSLGPLDELIPELAAHRSDEPPPTGGQRGADDLVPEMVPSSDHFIPLSAASLQIVQSSQVVAEAGLEPARPYGQRILNPPRLPFRHSAVVARASCSGAGPALRCPTGGASRLPRSRSSLASSGATVPDASRRVERARREAGGSDAARVRRSRRGGGRPGRGRARRRAGRAARLRRAPPR